MNRSALPCLLAFSACLATAASQAETCPRFLLVDLPGANRTPRAISVDRLRGLFIKPLEEGPDEIVTADGHKIDMSDFKTPETQELLGWYVWAAVYYDSIKNTNEQEVRGPFKSQEEAAEALRILTKVLNCETDSTEDERANHEQR